MVALIWEFFKKVNGEAQCSLCKEPTSFKIPGGSTSNLLRHMNNKHPEKSKVLAPSNSPLFKHKPKMGSAANQKIDRKLAIHMASSFISLNVVNQATFTDFLYALNPSYTCPSRKKISSLILEEANSIKARYIELLGNVTHVSLTCDGWSSPKNAVTFLSITAHFYHPDSKDRSNIILDCLETTSIECMDGATIADILQSVMNDYAITSKVTAICCDGASNLQSGLAILGLSRFCREYGEPMALLNMDSPTRWNSTYTMLCAAVNHRKSLIAISKFVPCVVVDDDFTQLTFLLKPLSNINTISNLSARSDSTFSSIQHWCMVILKGIRHEKSFTRGEKLTLLDDLLSLADRQFKNCLENSLMSEATYLDPRYSYSTAIYSTSKWHDIAATFLQGSQEYEEKEEESIDHVVPTGDWLEIHSKSVPRRKKLAIEQEIERYEALLLNTSRPDYSSNPADWWAIYQKELPQLAKQFWRIAAVPSSSVDSERLFSACGILYGNKRRRRLTGRMSRAVLLVYGYNKYKPSLAKKEITDHFALIPSDEIQVDGEDSCPDDMFEEDEESFNLSDSDVEP